MVTYDEALEFLNDASQYGSVLGLDSMKTLLDELGNPQDQLKFVHVAGTNGKGSTAAYIATILAEAGYYVGRYISPSVFGYLEKIQILSKQYSPENGFHVSTETISEAGIVNCIDKIKEVCRRMTDAGLPHPTVFEIETAMAMLYFMQKECKVVVLEVGLGGRLDATNVISTTECAVITSISMDHMHILGNTLEQIAFEKAGIIKDGIQVVSYQQDKRASKVIEQVCREKNASLSVADFSKIEILEQSIHGTLFHYDNLNHCFIPLLGENQVHNAIVAIHAIRALIRRGYFITDENVKNGLKQTKWRGRFEVIHKKPLFLIDGAHNEDAAISLAKNIMDYFTGKRIIYLLGILADKDYNTILKHTASLADTIITLTPNNPRALKSEILAETARNYCKYVINADNITSAVQIAMDAAGEEDIIIAFGSLSYLKEVTDFVESAYMYRQE